MFMLKTPSHSMTSTTTLKFFKTLVSERFDLSLPALC